MKNIFTLVFRIVAWALSGLGLYLLTTIEPTDRFYKIVIGLALLICAIAFILYSINALASLLIRKKIYSYLTSKIHEFSHFLIGDKKLHAPAKFKYDCYQIHEKYYDLSGILNKFICYNQGVYAGYSLLAGDLHKELRLAKENSSSSEETLKKCVQDLQIKLYKEFRKIMNQNVKRFMTDYFRIRPGSLPRIIIKGWHGNEIIDIYRIHYGPTFNTERPSVYSNTGFIKIRETGRYYLCNNIPYEAYHGNYKNNRLDNDKLKQLFTQEEIDQGNINFAKWKQCWSRYTVKETSEVLDPHDNSCYQSTLIIPITILNNDDLNDSITKRFKLPRLDHPEVGRIFFGFLCFDNKEANYFNEDIDWLIGYIFADIISLYLIDFLRYTQYSKTFEEVVEKFPEISQYYTKRDSGTFMQVHES